jgi:hypothetical protein
MACDLTYQPLGAADLANGGSGTDTTDPFNFCETEVSVP